MVCLAWYHMIQDTLLKKELVETPNQLIQLANQNGGTDNITVLVGCVTTGKNKNGFFSKIFKL